MTTKQLQKFCKKPIIKDKELIGKIIYEMAMLPVPYLYNQDLTAVVEGERRGYSEWSIRQISYHLMNSMDSEALYSYDALQKCSVMQMLSRIKRVLLSDRDEGWVLYVLARLYLGFAVDMETGTVLTLKTDTRR